MMSQFAGCLAEEYADRLGEEGRRLITSIVDGTDRMQTLISDLLEYSRVSREPPERTPVDCSAVFLETLELLEESIAEKGASVTADPLPAISAHPTQLRQIFQNLISNALKFSGDSPLRVHVSANREPGAWRFSVQDNGIGIEPHQAKRVFELFRRLHPQDAYAGTGMGLSICHRIVERHGGRMWVEPAPGGGTTFYFTIPDSPGG
jgi:signal transduction histidine kinase